MVIVGQLPADPKKMVSSTDFAQPHTPSKGLFPLGSIKLGNSKKITGQLPFLKIWFDGHCTVNIEYVIFRNRLNRVIVTIGIKI